MRILFLSKWFPYPPDNGSKLRIYHLLRGLAQHHELTLLSFVEGVEPSPAALQALCTEIQTVPWKAFAPHSQRAQLGFLRTTPRSVVDTFSPEMAQRIQRLLAAKPYDLIIASQWQMAAYAPYFQGRPALLEELEVGLYYEQFAHATSVKARLRYGLTWLKHRHYLAQQLRYFQACTVASSQEQQLLAQVVPDYKAITVIPNCVQLADYQLHQPLQPNQLIFTGSFRYAANYDAMRWFLQHVYARIQAQTPAVQILITGDHADLPLPAAANVIRTGVVDDVRPLIAQAWSSLVPIRQGGGTRLKVLEAMALGTPVVATTKGAEGLDLRPDTHLLVANTPESYAAAVTRLLHEPGLRQRLAASAYQVISQKYDWAATLPRFLDLAGVTARGEGVGWLVR